MRKFLSLILCCILIFPCFVFTSFASPVDSDNFSSDIISYCNSNLNVSNPSNSFTYNFIFNESNSFKYIDMVVVTDCNNFDVADNVVGGSILVEFVAGNTWRVHGTVDALNVENYILTVTLFSTCTYFNLLKCNVIYDSYQFFNLPLTYQWRDDYHTESGTYTSYPVSMNSYVSNQVGGHETFYLFNLTFDWEKYDYVTIYFQDFSTQLIDFTANVDLIDVVSSFNRYAEHSCYLTLDFTSLNPEVNSNICNIGLSGSEMLYDTSAPIFTISSVVAYVELVEDSFWPAWIQRIIDKFDQLIDSLTGTQQDLDNSNSFNDSVSDQATELEDMTSIMTSVEQPDIADVNLNLNGVVDSNSVVLATTGFKTILQNEIILKVLLIAFTFALVGFILYGKKG